MTTQSFGKILKTDYGEVKRPCARRSLRVEEGDGTPPSAWILSSFSPPPPPFEVLPNRTAGRDVEKMVNIACFINALLLTYVIGINDDLCS